MSESPNTWYPPDIPSYAPVGDPPMAGIGQVPQGAPREVPPAAEPPYTAPEPARNGFGQTVPAWPGSSHTAPAGAPFSQASMPALDPFYAPQAGPGQALPPLYPSPYAVGVPMSPYAPTSPGPGWPTPYAGPPAPTNNRPGNIALACGIGSVVLLGIIGAVSETSTAVELTAPWFAVTIGAIVFGALGIRAAGRREATNRGMAVAGMVLGIVLGAAVLLIALGFALPSP